MTNLLPLPSGATLRSVTASPVEIDGRQALRVELEPAITAIGKPGIDYVDMPTFVVLPVTFATGTISVAIRSRLNQQAPDYARAFAGLAYRISDEGQQFESVYVRPMNGLKVSPPSPRDRRAIQYFAFPDWKFDRLREEFPDGPFEAGAEIGPDEWIDLRVEVREATVSAWVNGKRVLTEVPSKGHAKAGAVGLWVDIGTEAFFADLVVSPS